ncbi:hypothetical protein SDC9_69095 [bioreactor metagenome]|uniref:Uncharacterized protein n=1 Tax=bioreactor metagenome TaxID=1076179 RepID=A0A644Y3C1_9ZZZZ
MIAHAINDFAEKLNTRVSNDTHLLKLLMELLIRCKDGFEEQIDFHRLILILHITTDTTKEVLSILRDSNIRAIAVAEGKNEIPGYRLVTKPDIFWVVINSKDVGEEYALFKMHAAALLHNQYGSNINPSELAHTYDGKQKPTFVQLETLPEKYLKQNI